MPRVIRWSILLFVLFELDVISGNIIVSPILLEVNGTATLSCNLLPLSQNSLRYWDPPSTVTGQVVCSTVKCGPAAVAGYIFKADSTKIEVVIESLNRSRDGKEWTCSNGNVTYRFSLSIYTLPQRLDITQSPNTDVDLSISMSMLQCRTSSCTYPEPSIQWLYKDQPDSNTYKVYNKTTPVGMIGPCAPLEMLYTSTLVLPQNTTLSDNSDKRAIFTCNIEYPGVSTNISASGTNTVRFAVRITQAILQENNMDIASPLIVTSEKSVILTCATGTGRPAPTIDWYIGSQWKGSGTNLNYIPNNVDHNQTIYCKAYNTDPNQAVTSSTPKIYVRVRVMEAFLQINSVNVTSPLTLTSEELVTLTCVTGTSRPDPIIHWYIGSQWKGNGTVLHYIPNNADHNQIIYCQAYNIDPSLTVYSNKPSLFITVYVSAITLDPPGAIVTFLDGIEKSLRCTTSPCRPQPVIRWRLDGNEVTNLSHTEVKEMSSLFVASSELRLTLDKTQQGKKVYCEADVNGRVYESTKAEINVLYTPDVKLNISGSTAVNSTAVLMCIPEGNPPQYTFHPWIHMVGQTEISRPAGINRVSFSTLTLPNISFQDMGTYKCTVDNAVSGRDGQINQTGDLHVYIQGQPVIGEKQSTFTGEANKSSSIPIPFYSNPSIRTLKFIKQLDSVEISNTSDISIYILPLNITMMFYMKKVTIPGHVAVLYFRNLKDTDFGNYTLQLFNDLGTVSVQFDFVASAQPSVPTKFFLSHTEGSFLVFGIEKGFNGGHEQTFVIEYQPFGMSEASWSTIFKINETDLDDPFSNGTYYIKIPKIQDGLYVFKVYAENKKGNSAAIEGVYVEIKTELLTVNSDVPVGPVVGGVVGAVLVIAIIAVVLVIRKRTLKPKLRENMKREPHGSIGPEYINTAFMSDINTTEYEALQLDRTGAGPYETLNNPKSKLNQSTDIRNSSDPRPSAGEMLYDKLQPCDTNQGHMYSSLSSPRLDEGENKFYENTVMSTKYIPE